MSQVSLQRYWRAIRVLRLLEGSAVVNKAPIEKTVELGDSRLSYYSPESTRGPALVLLHGVTPRGAQDRRLVRLARVLAAEGVTALVPQLPGLASFKEDIEDLSHIEQAIRFAGSDGAQRVSIMGFSLGGGYGLVSAAQPEVSATIERVTVIGGHHRLDEVWANVNARLCTLLSRISLATEGELYCVLSCAASRLGVEQLGTEATEALQTFLWRYCDGIDLALVRQFIVSHLAPYWSIISTCQATTQSLALSPVGRLGDIRAPVVLLHAPDDTMVAEHHAIQNFQELQQRPGGSQTLLSTRLLNHVRPRLSGGWRELPRLVDCFANLLP